MLLPLDPKSNWIELKAEAPLSSIISVPGAAPGCVSPLIATCSIIAGREPVSAMVKGPAPGIVKLIISAPGVALARRMHLRSEFVRSPAV